MNQKNENTDFLDDLFRKHLNDENFKDTNLADFGEMVRNTIREEVKKQGIELNEGKKPQYQGSSRERRYESRYDFVKETLESSVYFARGNGYFKAGYQDAIDRYLKRMAINQNDMIMFEKIVEKDLRELSSSRNSSDRYDAGYYDGLKRVNQVLLQSRDMMMEEINDRLSAALRIY